MKKYCLGIMGRKRKICFKSIKERNKVIKLIKNKLTYSTWNN